MSRYFTGKKVR